MSASPTQFEEQAEALEQAVSDKRLRAEKRLIDAAFAGDDERVRALLARWPDLASTSLPCALALGEPGAVDTLTPDNVNTETGPYAWPPLLYLCHYRHANANPEHRTACMKLLEGLLGLGADPNAGTRETESVRGYRTALGAAIGRARDPGMAKALLDAGADIADGPTLYEGCAMWEAIRHGDVESLEALLARDPPQWHVCHALPHGLQYDDVALTRLLLENGGDPNWTMGCWGFDGNCLHEAVVLGNSPAVLAALLEHGAQPDFADRDGRTPLALATCLNRDALAAVLREHGARDDAVRDVDRWIGACFADDGDAAARLATRQPALPACRPPLAVPRGSHGEPRRRAPPARRRHRSQRHG